MALTRYEPQDTGKSYATPAGAIRAAEKKYGNPDAKGVDLTYIVLPVFVKNQPEPRYVPVFIGERALRQGVQFHFHVLG